MRAQLEFSSRLALEVQTLIVDASLVEDLDRTNGRRYVKHDCTMDSSLVLPAFEQCWWRKPLFKTLLLWPTSKNITAFSITPDTTFCPVAEFCESAGPACTGFLREQGSAHHHMQPQRAQRRSKRLGGAHKVSLRASLRCGHPTAPESLAGLCRDLRLGIGHPSRIWTRKFRGTSLPGMPNLFVSRPSSPSRSVTRSAPGVPRARGRGEEPAYQRSAISEL